MRRFWILFRTELKVWRRDPITALGGFIPPSLILIAFGLLLGGRLSFKLAVINHDAGPYGEVLRQTLGEVQSPFGVPYYGVLDLSEDQAWEIDPCVEAVETRPVSESYEMKVGKRRSRTVGGNELVLDVRNPADAKGS